MTPLLVTLYGDGSSLPGSRVMLGGGRGAAVDLDSAGMGFDFSALFSAIGKGVTSIAQGVNKAKGDREKAKQQAAAAARLAAIAAQKRKMILYAGIGGGLLLAGGAYLYTRKKRR